MDSIRLKTHVYASCSCIVFICVCVFAGRANLPGSVTERQLLESFSRMLPGTSYTALDECHHTFAHMNTNRHGSRLRVAELLRFSSASHLLGVIPEAQQQHHRREKGAALSAPLKQPTRTVLAKPQQQNLWEGWEDGALVQDTAPEASDDDEMDLEGLGL